MSRYSGCGRLWGSRSAGLALAPHFVHDHLARVAHALGERAQAGRADTAGSESQGENAEDLCSTSVATDVEQTGEARWVRAAELVRWWGSLGQVRVPTILSSDGGRQRASAKHTPARGILSSCKDPHNKNVPRKL